MWLLFHSTNHSFEFVLFSFGKEDTPRASLAFVINDFPVFIASLI